MKSRRTKFFAFAIAVIAALAICACSSEPSIEETFKLGETFTHNDMEYTIESIVPAEDDYPEHKLHNGIMYLKVHCKSLADGTEPDLEDYLILYNSNGDGAEKTFHSDMSTDEGNIGVLKEGAERDYTISFGYDYEEPWYELELIKSPFSTKKEKVASFKFSIDPETLEVSEVE